MARRCPTNDDGHIKEWSDGNRKSGVSRRMRQGRETGERVRDARNPQPRGGRGRPAEEEGLAERLREEVRKGRCCPYFSRSPVV